MKSILSTAGSAALAISMALGGWYALRRTELEEFSPDDIPDGASIGPGVCRPLSVPRNPHQSPGQLPFAALSPVERRASRTADAASFVARSPPSLISTTYVSRIVRMTLLAPDIVEAILNGTHSSDVTPATMMRPFSVDWVRQRAFWESAFKARPET